VKETVDAKDTTVSKMCIKKPHKFFLERLQLLSTKYSSIINPNVAALGRTFSTLGKPI
jgi:hypothetical protein